MALFENWEDPVNCGDLPDLCTPIETIQTARAPMATEPETFCFKELISPDHPALMVSLSDLQTELRSGSAARPIPINAVQHTQSPKVPTLAFRNNKGELAVWNPPPDCSGKKVVFESDQFQLKDDINSNVFDKACIGAYDDVTYMVGAVLFTDCNGNEKMKLVFFPKDELPIGS